MRKPLKTRVLDCVPTTWLDSLLTGPTKVVGEPPYSCPAIEALCKAIRQRIEAVKFDVRDLRPARRAKGRKSK